VNARPLPRIALAAAVCLLPLAGALHRLIHPGPWLAFVAACVLLLTQPPLGPRTMVADARDRLTGLGIFIAQIGAAVVALVDFGYRPELRPAPISAWTLGGLLVIAAGLGVRLWAIRTLGRFFTATVHVAEGQSVVSGGPYRLLRHPSYTGALLVPLGISLALQSAAGVLVGLLVGVPAYLYRIHVEEAALCEGIGQPYRDYRAHTWRLVPYVY
jgi:protein-S-isoprenylcysteine O-methyltransferase Ste14